MTYSLFTVKAYMTVAMILYVIAFLGAKKWPRGHIAIALVGFGIDIYATALMEIYRTASHLTSAISLSFLKFHTAVSMAALAAFIVQATLGALKMRTVHIVSAKYFFLPCWIVSYCSGIYLIL